MNFKLILDDSKSNLNEKLEEMSMDNEIFIING